MFAGGDCIYVCIDKGTTDSLNFLMVKITRIDYEGFDWDAGNVSKVQKHGMSVKEVEEFFGQELLVIEDQKHAQEESRMIAAGLSRGKRPVFVAFMVRFRGELKLIRVISARYMHKKEREFYENLKKTLET